QNKKTMPLKKRTNKKPSGKKKLELLGLISFLFGFAQALLLYVTSDYFRDALGNENVSSFYFITYVIALIGLLNMHKVIKVLGKATSFFLFFFSQICFLVGLIFVRPSLVGIIFLMFYIIANYFVWVVLDVIIEEY